jgi:outer membrane protein OmpA-like peptidoglycan-associated protein
MRATRHAALPILLSVGLVVAGCSIDTWFGGDSPSDADRCGELLTDPAADAKPAGVTVLLADGSASAFTRPEPAKRDDWAGKLVAYLPSELPADGGDLVAIGLFGGAVDWQTEKLTPAKSRDAQRTKNDFEDSHDCLEAELDRTMKIPPSKSQSDVLRALAEGAEYVKQWPGTKSIYLATDGLTNTGCADLRAASIGDRTAIKGIVEGCAAELPNLDATYAVHFVGVGNSMSGWPDIKTPQRTWIKDLWMALCRATQATCAEPDSAKPGIMNSAEVKLPADNDVAMPTITIKQDNPTVLSVPSSLLFDTDSYVLAPDRSQDSLQQVYDFLKQLHPQRIEVDGHTDSRGTPEHNQQLSENRAAAVAA